MPYFVEMVTKIEQECGALHLKYFVVDFQSSINFEAWSGNAFDNLDGLIFQQAGWSPADTIENNRVLSEYDGEYITADLIRTEYYVTVQTETAMINVSSIECTAREDFCSEEEFLEELREELDESHPELSKPYTIISVW
jgi:hypothetical protein